MATFLHEPGFQRKRVAGALVRLAKRVLAGGEYDRLKEYIAAKYNMLAEAGGLVNSRVGKGGYVVHHFQSPTRLIHSGLEDDVYERYRAVLSGEADDPKLKKTLEAEIAHIVFLPTWFHNYIHNNDVKEYGSRREYYKLLRLVLETAESYEKIKALKFHGGNITEALKSMRNLAQALPIQRSKVVLELLRQAYMEIQRRLLENLQDTLQ